MISKILLVQDQLLKEGRGFDFQSHGEKCGETFHNFALYAAPGTKESTHYINGFDTDEIAKQVKELMGESKAPLPKMQMMPLPMVPLGRG